MKTRYLAILATLAFFGFSVPAAAHDCSRHNDQTHKHCGGDDGGKPITRARADFRDLVGDGVRSDLSFSARMDVLQPLSCSDPLPAGFSPDSCSTGLLEVDFWDSEDGFRVGVDSAFEDRFRSLFPAEETEVRSASLGSSTFPAYVFFSTAPFPNVAKTPLIRWLVLDFSNFPAPAPNIDVELYDITNICGGASVVPAGTEGYLPDVNCDPLIDNVIAKMVAGDAFSPPGDPFLDTSVNIGILVPTDVKEKGKGKDVGQITLQVVFSLRYKNDLRRCDMFQDESGKTLGRVTITTAGVNAEAELLDENGALIGTGNFPMEMTLERVFCNESGTCSPRVPDSATMVAGSGC